MCARNIRRTNFLKIINKKHINKCKFFSSSSYTPTPTPTRKSMIYKNESVLFDYNMYVPNSKENYRIVPTPTNIAKENNKCNEYNEYKEMNITLTFLEDNKYIYEPTNVTTRLMVNENEIIVLYKYTINNVGARVIQRKIIKGPVLYIPGKNERVHQFSWDGANIKDSYLKKRDTLHFKKFNINPSKMLYNVENARTKDGTQISVRMEIFYELVDIEKMLNTNDIVAEFMNGTSFDITNFLSKYSHEEFKTNILLLNEISTFKRLLERAAASGYKINKVTIRGSDVSGNLQ